MGFFVYDDVRAIRVDDRVLAHLQIVVIDKLRRQEKFVLNLNNGHGLVTMWLNAYTPMQFVYEGNGRHGSISRGSSSSPAKPD